MLIILNRIYLQFNLHPYKKLVSKSSLLTSIYDEKRIAMATIKQTAIWISMLLLWVEIGSAKTETPVPVTEATIRRTLEVGLRDLVQQNGDAPLDLKQSLDELKENLNKKLNSNIETDPDGSQHFSPEVTHYIREGSRNTNKEERTEHLRHCIICNRMLHSLFANIGVQVPQFELPFTAVYLHSYGRSDWFRVDPYTGYLYRILNVFGTTASIASGRLVEQNGKWWATDGWLWLGPIESWRP